MLANVMSYQLPARAFHDDRLGYQSLRLLMLLSKLATDEQIECSQRDLAQHLKTTARTTQRALSTLASAGYIQVDEVGGRRPNIIRLMWSQNSAEETDSAASQRVEQSSNHELSVRELSMRLDELTARVGSLRWQLPGQMVEERQQSQPSHRLVTAPPSPPEGLQTPTPDLFINLDNEDEDRDLLFKTTLRLVGKHGYANVTLEQIVRTAALKGSKIVDYYANKHELCLDTIRAVYILTDLSLRVTPSGNMEADFTRLLEQYWQMWRSHEYLVAFILDMIKFDDVVAIIVETTTRSVESLLNLYGTYRHHLDVPKAYDDVMLEDEISASLLGPVLAKAIWHHVQIAEARVEPSTLVKRWLYGYMRQ